jgi:hypothetical protein
MKTIGEFYREKILSLPENLLTKREIPYSFLENMEIKKELFGWKIFYTRPGRKSLEVIECRSKEEARYLGILIDSGMTEISVPKDDEYIKSILPEMERIKTKIDEILNSYLETILDRKIREQLKYTVFMEITK